MKLFFGKSKDLWVISPRTGSVRRVSFGTILSGLVAVVAVSAAGSTYMVNRQAVTTEIKRIFTPADKLSVENRALALALQEARQKEAESRRLQAKFEDKLNSLKGILGEFADSSAPAKDTHEGLFKKTSLGSSQTGSIEHLRNRTQPRQNIRNLEHIIRQIRGLPLRPPLAGEPRLSSGFGYRLHPLTGHTHLHSGVDLSFGPSTDVFATGNGVVSSVGYSSGYGLTVDVQHNQNVVTRYAHLSKILVKEGERVKAGQIIARGGSTGSTTGAHLHYEVRIRGRARDPEIFLNLSRKLQVALRQLGTSNG